MALFGVPTLRLGWSAIGAIELVRGPFGSAPRGVSFLIDGKRLVFWTYAIEAILDQIDRHAPKSVVTDREPKRIFFSGRLGRTP